MVPEQPEAPLEPEEQAAMHPAVAEWVRLAERDISSAEVLLAAGDTENALFLCQQAVEKALKAHVQSQSEEPPPRIHSLVKLAHLATLWKALGDTRQELLVTLDPYAVAGRYGVLASAPEGLPDLADLIAQTRETVAWLLAALRSSL